MFMLVNLRLIFFLSSLELFATFPKTCTEYNYFYRKVDQLTYDLRHLKTGFSNYKHRKMLKVIIIHYLLI